MKQKDILEGGQEEGGQEAARLWFLWRMRFQGILVTIIRQIKVRRLIEVNSQGYAWSLRLRQAICQLNYTEVSNDVTLQRLPIIMYIDSDYP